MRFEVTSAHVIFGTNSGFNAQGVREGLTSATVLKYRQMSDLLRHGEAFQSHLQVYIRADTRLAPR